MNWLSAGLTGLLSAAILSACGSGTGSGSGHSGDEGAKGGDIVAQQAALVVEDAVNRIRSMPEVFPEVNQAQLAAAAARVKIIVKPKTYANGVETDAINNGLDTIELNISRWKRIYIYHRKLALIAHELFGLMGVENSANYSVSRRILVEGRFNSNRLYECHGQSWQGSQVKCTMRLRYSSMAHNFTLEDLNCEHPGIEGFTNAQTYSYMNDELYSLRGGCQYPDDSDDPGLCSISSGTGREYDTLVFDHGYRFHFEGFVKNEIQQQVHCGAI